MHMACGIHVVLNLSNRASDNILEFLSPHGMLRSYSTVTIISRQLPSYFDSYDHTPWTVTIMSPMSGL